VRGAICHALARPLERFCCREHADAIGPALLYGGPLFGPGSIPEGGEVGRIEIVLAGDPDHREQGIAPGIRRRPSGGELPSSRPDQPACPKIPIRRMCGPAIEDGLPILLATNSPRRKDLLSWAATIRFQLIGLRSVALPAEVASASCAAASSALRRHTSKWLS